MRRITVIGTGTAGTGTAGTGTPESPALAAATLVVGARRHLDAAAVPPAAERIALGPLPPALDAIAHHLSPATVPAPSGGRDAAGPVPRGGPAARPDQSRENDGAGARPGASDDAPPGGGASRVDVERAAAPAGGPRPSTDDGTTGRTAGGSRPGPVRAAPSGAEPDSPRSAPADDAEAAHGGSQAGPATGGIGPGTPRTPLASGKYTPGHGTHSTTGGGAVGDGTDAGHAPAGAPRAHSDRGTTRYAAGGSRPGPAHPAGSGTGPDSPDTAPDDDGDATAGGGAAGGPPGSAAAGPEGGPAHAAGSGATGERSARSVVVLASGDPGFFGIVRALAGRFGPEALTVEPSVPSVAAAFARAGLPWDDAVVVSAHGRDPRTAVNVCRAHPKTAVLTGPGAGPAELGTALARADAARTLVVATALGTARESVLRLSPAEAAGRDWPEPVSVVLCLDESRALASARRAIAGPAAGRPAEWALSEEDFAHRDSMITKFEVRALALARLGPRPGDLVWDVGSGSGALAVECVRLGAAAIAVEKAADAVEHIRANAAGHGVDVQAVHGTAPAALHELPAPDAVFVGGGGQELPAVVRACARRARRAVVVTLAALDRVPTVQAALTGEGLRTAGVLLQSSRLAPLPGDVTRLAATNPVFVLWGVRAPDHLEGATP